LPRASTWRIALLSLGFSIVVEVCELYHAPWIDSIRTTTLGGLVPGYGFVGSDLACYAAGVVPGTLSERTSLSHRPTPST
jgi:hypothetical protein